MEAKCENPSCKCNGKCKVCKCNSTTGVDGKTTYDQKVIEIGSEERKK